jgi:hypothetical protein
MHAVVNGVRLFFDVEGARLVPDGPAMREKPTLRPVGRPEVLRWFTKPGGESQTFDLFPDLHRIRCRRSSWAARTTRFTRSRARRISQPPCRRISCNSNGLPIAGTP